MSQKYPLVKRDLKSPKKQAISTPASPGHDGEGDICATRNFTNVFNARVAGDMIVVLIGLFDLTPNLSNDINARVIGTRSLISLNISANGRLNFGFGEFADSETTGGSPGKVCSRARMLAEITVSNVW
jgi:hypothetical protein